MQRHIQKYPGCPFVSGKVVGVNLIPPNFTENHPSLKILKKTDEVVRKVRINYCCNDSKTISIRYIKKNFNCITS